MGTPAFSIPTLTSLNDSGHTIPAVVTRPDAPKGRGQRLSPPEAKVEAAARGIPVYQPARLTDPGFLAALSGLKPDAIVVAAYGKILPNEILVIPPHGCINLHPSLLPKYRGPAPVQRALLGGEKTTGVTVMKIAEKTDSGPIILQKEVPIGEEDTGEDLGRRLALIGAGLMVEALTSIEQGTAVFRPQNDDEATYAPFITKEEGKIDWSVGAPEIRNRVRGLLTWPGAFTSLGGKRIKIIKARAVESGAAGPPGTITEAGQEGIRVSTGKGDLVILELQMEGKKAVGAAEFLRGHKVSSGMVCGH